MSSDWKQHLTKAEMKYHLIRSFNLHGIEKTEEIITRVYSQYPEIQKEYLLVYRNLITGKEK